MRSLNEYLERAEKFAKENTEMRDEILARMLDLSSSEWWGIVSDVPTCEEKMRMFMEIAETIQHYMNQDISDPRQEIVQELNKMASKETNYLISSPAPRHSSNEFSNVIDGIKHGFKGTRIETFKNWAKRIEEGI